MFERFRPPKWARRQLGRLFRRKVEREPLDKKLEDVARNQIFSNAVETLSQQVAEAHNGKPLIVIVETPDQSELMIGAWRNGEDDYQTRNAVSGFVSNTYGGAAQNVEYSLDRSTKLVVFDLNQQVGLWGYTELLMSVDDPEERRSETKELRHLRNYKSLGLKTTLGPLAMLYADKNEFQFVVMRLDQATNRIELIRKSWEEGGDEPNPDGEARPTDYS